VITVGIDPGLSGAFAALVGADSEGPEFISDAIDMPTMPDGSKNQVDDFAVGKWLRMIRPNQVIIENVRAMPAKGRDAEGNETRRSMGTASSFRFGLVVGQVRATVRSVLGIEPELVEPGSWKRYFALTANKEEARQLALKLWPMSEYLLRRKKDQGRAEAMLLAKWGARPLIGKNFHAA
jgi:hypothetical protein